MSQKKWKSAGKFGHSINIYVFAYIFPTDNDDNDYRESFQQ